MMKKITVKNPNNLPTTDYHKLKILQGDLKTLSEENKTKLCKSILKHGYFVPAFIWRSGEDIWILDATQRYYALEQLEKEGYEIPEIPYIEIEAKDKKEASEKLLQITSRYGEINIETTFFEDFNIDVSFLEEIEIPELNILLEDIAPEIVEDDVPEPPAEPLSKTGDLWFCGRHRVLCGDATKAADVERLMDGKKADMVFTDMPYGVSYADKNIFLNAIDKGNCIQDKIEGDHNTVTEMKDLWVAALKNAFNTTKEGGAYYVCAPQGGELMMMMMSLLEAGWELKHCLIWVKNNHVLGRSDYNYKHEPILYGWKAGAGHNFYGGSGEVSVFEIDKPHKSDLHPVMKPVELVAKTINNSSKTNELITDFFLGSGTTLIACEQLNRICHGMEIAPMYIDVILDRYAKFTEKDPTREDGIKWSELKSSSEKRTN